jgi:hypothetical protein
MENGRYCFHWINVNNSCLSGIFHDKYLGIRKKGLKKTVTSKRVMKLK